MQPKNKGVTLTSLTVYIIVSIIVFGSLTFLNINFMSQVAELSTKSENANELLKVEAYIIDDAKNATGVSEYSSNWLKFDNGVEYLIRYRSDSKISGDQTYNVYELYRNGVLITDQMSKITFDYGKADAGDGSKTLVEWIKLELYYKKNGNLYGTKEYIRVGNRNIGGKNIMWKKRGSVTMTALMAMLVFSIYGIALYGRSVSAYILQEKEINHIQEIYSKDLDRVYEIADKLK